MKRSLLVCLTIAALGLTAWAKCGDCCKRGAATERTTVAATAPDAAAKLKDPVCGMDVDPAKAVKKEHAGKTYYFCSKNCKDKFDKDPAQYIGQTK